MAEKDKGTDRRLTLTITEVKERQPIGEKGAVKLNFKAKGEDGDKEFWYFTFSQRLFETIEQGKGRELECDVNISTREWDGNTYTDRKVFQIYMDGQPVGGRRPGGYQDSPEKIVSIESQKRADIIAQLWIAGKFDGNGPEVGKLKTWLGELGESALVVAPKVEAPKAEKAKPQASKASAPTPEPDDLMNLPIKNLGDLFKACYEHFKLTQTAALKELGGITKEQIADPLDSWRQIVSTRI